MKYPYMVKYNGKWYNPSEEIPESEGTKEPTNQIPESEAAEPEKKTTKKKN